MVDADRLTTHHPYLVGESTEGMGQHQRPIGSRVVHVGELVVSLLQGECRHVFDRRPDDENCARWTLHLDGIDHDQYVGGLGEELLNEMDAPDADIHHPDEIRKVFGSETLDHCDAKAVIATEDVSHPGNQHLHPLTLPVMGDSSLAKLHRALTRFPPDRYPVKGASLHRQIAHELAAEGKLAEAELSLRTALDLYRHDLPMERGETLNALGAVLRERGQPGEASGAFGEAIELLEGAAASPAQVGAAYFNLGLVRREMGDTEAAESAFRRAVSSFDAGTHPAELGAALRELGALLLVEGREADALPYLQSSAEHAAAGGDRGGLGASANLIGLATLALGDGVAAIDAFAETASAHPFSLRPEAHAMAKANLALAYESIDDSHRARQLAHQTLSIGEAPPPVAEQASAILDRLGPDYDLHLVLDTAPQETWPGVLRDEVRHWARSGAPLVGQRVSAWVSGIMDRGATAVEREEAMFAAILELPPEDFDTITTAITTSVAALSPDQATRYRAQAKRAAARFHLPQMQRLEAALELERP